MVGRARQAEMIARDQALLAEREAVAPREQAERLAAEKQVDVAAP
jgi:hypothetical protein